MTVNDHKQELIETAHLYRIFNDNDDTERGEKAKLFARKILKDQFIIGFAGHFSSGKSSMINALTGETLLPSSPIPTSANIVNVHKAEQDYAIVNRRGGRPVYFPENYDFQAVKDFCKSGDVTQIDIGHSTSVLPEGITVMDTPGVDSTDDAHRMSTESALHVADMVFYVMDYNHVQSELNFNFTRELQKYTELYLIVNQIDKHQESEMSFEQFQNSVAESFAAWGVEPKGIYFTSLKVDEFPGNEFPQVKELVSSVMDNWQGHIGEASASALRQLKDEHIRYLEDEKAERLETFADVLSEEEWIMKEDLINEHELLKRRSNVQDYEKWRLNFEKNRKELLENANIMPYEVRDALTSYLESRQPGFKVGLLFSGKKTEEERMTRKKDLDAKLSKTVDSQMIGHLKKLMKASLREAGLLTDSESLRIDQLDFTMPFSVVEEHVPAVSAMTADTVLNVSKSLSAQVQRFLMQESDPWKASQKERFEGLSDETGVEIDMKSETLEQKVLAIRTLEEMDAAIDKVKKAFTAILPKQLEAAKQQVQEWQQAFHLSKEDMTEFTPSMLETEEGQQEEAIEAEPKAELAAFDEAAVLRRARKTAQLLEPVRGFAETVDYLKRKAKRLEGQEFTIALFGAFSAGKSSFSNALMGETVLPVSPNPTTATINRIRPVNNEHPHETADVRLKTVAAMTEDVKNSFAVFGMAVGTLEEAYNKITSLPEQAASEQQIHKSFLLAFEKGYESFAGKLGTTVRVGREEFSAYVAKEERSCFVEEIDFYFDCELTRSGVTLVDTPGADSINARHTNVAFEYIRNADAVLFITYYNHAFARADREFLIQLGRVKDAFEMDKMFFVVNAIDLANSEEEKQAVIDYVGSELQRFGIRFPRLYGVSSLLALKERERSGMPEFEKDFQHFLTEELKGMAVQSLSEEEQKTVDRFRSLIASTEKNLQRKDERLAELQQLEQKVRKRYSETMAPVLEQEANQELGELLYYVKQRVFYRFNDFFKEAFNPSLFSKESSKQALDVALRDLRTMTAFDFQQELRVTNLRLARFIEKKLEQRFKDDAALLKDWNREFSFLPYEVEEAEPIDVGEPFVGTDYSSAKSYYKNNKSFFEKNEKEAMRDALQAMMEPDASTYLDSEKSKLNDWAVFWVEQEAEGLRQHLLRQSMEQIDSERSLLQQSEILAEWKNLHDKLMEGRGSR